MKIYLVALAMVTSVAALSRKVQRHDPDLARQMRRSSTSVPLNMAEGWHAVGGIRTARFNTAIGEARETTTALEIARSCGYLTAEEVADRLDHIVAVLWKLCRTRRQ